MYAKQAQFSHLKTNDVIKTFQDQIKTKSIFSFLAVNENAEENEIPFAAENETKT